MARNNRQSLVQENILPLHGILTYCAMQCERCFEAAGCNNAVCFKNCASQCREIAAMLISLHYVLPDYLDVCADYCTECGIECEHLAISEQYLSCTIACMNCAMACREQFLAMQN